MQYVLCKKYKVLGEEPIGGNLVGHESVLSSQQNKYTLKAVAKMIKIDITTTNNFNIQSNPSYENCKIKNVSSLTGPS